MKWSWKIGTFAGIDVFVHTTFLLLIGWIGLTSWIQENSILAVVSGVGFILALFASVVLHEYGHALTARRYGVKTKGITLYPIGGVARLERIPDVPIQELWVALAGPAVNVAIAAILYVGLALTSALEPLSSLTLTGGPFIERLMVTNLLLVGFNLIPAFPMDGGRVLRSLLALRLEYARATQIAASVGQALAVFFGIIGLFSNPFLIVIAVFVWMGAQGEAQMVRVKSSLSGIPVRRAMLTYFSTLSPDERLDQVMNRALAGPQKEFPVIEAGRVVGMLTRGDMVNALQKFGGATPVRQVMARDFETADPYEMLDEAFTRLQTSGSSTLPVLWNGNLVGLVTIDNIAEYIRLQSMLGGRRGFARG